MLAIDHIEAPLLRDLKLPEGACVVIVGAYKGDTAAFMLNHHPSCVIYAYEPQEWAFDRIPNDPRIVKKNVALTNIDGIRAMFEWGTDACTLLNVPSRKASADVSQVQCNDAVAELEQLPHAAIDLIIMNIEGYEYTLLPTLLRSKIVVHRWLVQYHHYADRFAPNFDSVRTAMREYFRERLIGKGWFYYE